MIPFRDALASIVPPTRLDLHARPARGSSLPEDVRRRAEAILGEDLSNVRIHVSSAPVRMRALAFTTGSDICFAPGRYDPYSPAGICFSQGTRAPIRVASASSVLSRTTTTP